MLITAAPLLLVSLFGPLPQQSYLEELVLTPLDQLNPAFALTLMMAGKKCPSVSHSIIRGAVPDGTVFVTVRCRGGGDYVILEGNGDKGVVLTCEQAAIIMEKTLGFSTGCWEPLNDPKGGS